ncbi:MAG: tetratricopeptide repeat protein [Deltaproteobacteria bacterium]|nr:tetratricopeptide repeat protein [Deltaproteobacteria bacterium]
MKRIWFFLTVMCCLGLAACGASGEKSSPGQEKQAQEWLEKGMAEFQKQEYDAAIASFNKSVELYPKSAVAYNMLGMGYRFKYNQVRNQELKDKEIAAFQKAVDLDPNYWIALINLGATYYFIGEKAKAAPLFKKALEVNPQHPEKEEIKKLIAEGEKQT